MNLYLLPIILLSVICVVFGVFLLLNREKLAKKFAIKAIPSPQKVNKICSDMFGWFCIRGVFWLFNWMAVHGRHREKDSRPLRPGPPI